MSTDRRFGEHVLAHRELALTVFDACTAAPSRLAVTYMSACQKTRGKFVEESEAATQALRAADALASRIECFDGVRAACPLLPGGVS